MTAVLGIALFFCAGALIFYHIHIRRTLNRLDIMLDEAIRGDFEVSSYDEHQLSRIESKLSRFLGASKLKKGQIEHEQENIRSLISDISHQTKTPIANVLLYAQLLTEQKDLPEDAEPLALEITAGAKKLDFLIQSLVKTSRLESGIIKVVPKRGDLRELIEAALKECIPKAREKSIELAAEPKLQPVYALFDPKWCSEALYNILDNAIKYTCQGGRVSVSVTAYELFTRLDVKDTGKGICEEDLPRIFGRFWRAKESSEEEGVGIGLYLAREIVAACGGYIKVSSTKNEGSLFSILFPNG